MPAVAAWSTYLTLTLAAGQDRLTLLRKMAESGDYWPRRLLALVEARWVRDDQERKIVEALVQDPVPVVRKYAVAVFEASKDRRLRPQTQPQPEDDILAPGGAQPVVAPPSSTRPVAPIATATQPISDRESLEYRLRERPAEAPTEAPATQPAGAP